MMQVSFFKNFELEGCVGLYVWKDDLNHIVDQESK